MDLKVCTGCGETKEYTMEFFHNVGGGKLRSRCRVCHNAGRRVWQAARRRKNGILRSERTAEKKRLFKAGCDEKGQPCKICGEMKSVDEFYPSHRYRKTSMCIPCTREWHKEYHKNTYEDNKKYYRDYYQENKESRQQWQSEYRKENWDKIKEYRKQPHIKIKRAQDKRIKRVLKSVGLRKSDSTVKYLGCTGRELVGHLESQWSPGMSWDNYGFKGWHIDHIRPCASFDFADEKQKYDCFHYTNLQPLWAEDNMAKGASWDSSGADSMIRFIDAKGADGGGLSKTKQ